MARPVTHTAQIGATQCASDARCRTAQRASNLAVWFKDSAGDALTSKRRPQRVTRKAGTSIATAGPGRRWRKARPNRTSAAYSRMATNHARLLHSCFIASPCDGTIPMPYPRVMSVASRKRAEADARPGKRSCDLAISAATARGQVSQLRSGDADRPSQRATAPAPCTVGTHSPGANR